jgi:hypothetical protein
MLTLLISHPRKLNYLLFRSLYYVMQQLLAFLPVDAGNARIKFTWKLGVFVSPVCRSTQSLRCLTKSKQQAEPIHKRVGAMTVAKLSNIGAVTQRSKANCSRNVDVKPVKSNLLTSD